MPASVELRDVQGNEIGGPVGTTLGLAADFLNPANYSFRFDNVQFHPGANEFRVFARACSAQGLGMTSDIDRVWDLQSDEPLPPTLDWIPSNTNGSRVQVQGHAAPGMHVRLHAQKLVGDSQPTSVETVGTPASDGDVWTDFTTGRFSGEVVLPEPGSYRVTARAINRANALSPEAFPKELVWDPGASSSERPAIAPVAAGSKDTRTLTMELAPKSLHLRFDGDYGRDSPLGRSLLSSPTRADELARRLLGAMTIRQDRPLSQYREDFLPDLFRDTHAAVKVVDEQVQVTLDSNHEFDFEAVDTSVRLSWIAGDFMTRAADSLTMKLDGYSANRSDPAPASKGPTEVVWKGGNFEGWSWSEAQKAEVATVQADIALDIARSPLTVGRLGIEDLLPDAGFWLASVISAVTVAIPFVWVVWLLRSRASVPWVGAATDSKLARLFLGLVTLCFLKLALDLVTARTWPADVDPSWDQNRNGAIEFLLAGAFIAFVGGWLSRLRPAAAVVAGAFLASAARAVLYASAIVLAVLWVGSKGWLPSRASVAMIWLLSFPYLAAVLVRWWRFGRLVLWPRHELFRSVTVVYAVVLVVLAAALAWPVETAWFDGAPDGRPGDVTAGLGSEYFVLLSLSPAIALVGFAAMLRSPSLAQQPVTAQLSLAVALFLNFWVATGGQQLGLPIVFALGWLLARYFMFVPKEEWVALAQRAPEVRRNRRTLAQATMRWFQAVDLSRSSGKLMTRVSSGELELAKAQKAQEDASTYLDKASTAVRLGTNMHAREVLLSVSPSASAWADGLRAARLGLLMALPVTAVNYAIFFRTGGLFSSSAVQFNAIQAVTVDTLGWVALAFFFGYYFTFLRGRSGVGKGIRLAVLLAVIDLPFWFMDPTTAWAILRHIIGFCEYVFFLAFIGAVIFDWRTLKAALDERLTPTVFLRMVGVGGVLSVGTAGATAVVGSIVAAAASEVFKAAATQVLTGAAPHAHP